MYASLTLFIERFTSPTAFLLTTAVVALGLMLISCGAEGGDRGDVVQIATTATSAPEPTPTATQAPTATIPPTPTETPYWAKKIIPGIAMEQFPPLNDRTDYELRNTQEWLNGEPTTIKDLREGGRIVLVDFWTYT